MIVIEVAMPHLVCPDASGRARVFSLKRKKIVTIGRSSENDVVVDDPGVLPSHAHVLCDAGGYTIAGMDSKCTILVNGRPKRTASLKPDDQITLGAVVLTFRMDDVPPPTSVGSSLAKEPGSDRELFDRLIRFSEAIIQDLSPEELFRKLLDQLIEITGASKGFIIRVFETGLDIPAARNVERRDLERSVDQVSDSIIKRVMDSREAVIVSDAVNDDRFGRSQSVVDLKLSSVMCVPLQFRDQLLGVLYLGNDRVANLFRLVDLEVLKVYAGQAALLLYNAQLMNELIVDNRALREELQAASLGRIIGQCDAIRRISRTIDKVASTDISVMVQGETGTGKELIAREMHARSNRGDKPFVSINCGAIPENLLESELFGHVKGAFTGAISNRVGKFEAANGGTVFLDEIGEMPVSLQVKLLRVLQERSIEKVGESHPTLLDFRVISATNQDLDLAIKEQAFREDLFYRLDEIRIVVPPLRERGEDILLLARYLLDKYASRYSRKRAIKGFSKDALTAMMRYYWPGNIRQMESKIKKAVIMGEEPFLSAEDLEIRLEASQSKIRPLSEAQADFTLGYIKEVLEINNWNKTKTARDLGVDPRTIFRYLEKINE